MSLLSELTEILSTLAIPVETGVFSDTAPNRYAVLTQLTDSYDLFADNRPHTDISEVRVSLFEKGNYLGTKKTMESAFLSADMTITDRRYITHDDDTGYHQYAIDVAKNYDLQED